MRKASSNQAFKVRIIKEILFEISVRNGSPFSVSELIYESTRQYASICVKSGFANDSFPITCMRERARISAPCAAWAENPRLRIRGGLGCSNLSAFGKGRFSRIAHAEEGPRGDGS